MCVHVCGKLLETASAIFFILIPLRANDFNFKRNAQDREELKQNLTSPGQNYLFALFSLLLLLWFSVFVFLLFTFSFSF